MTASAAGPERGPDPTAEEIAQARDPRVAFAAERTLLAWVRTGAALMGFGFVVARFGLFLRELAPTRGAGAAAVAAPALRTPAVSLWAGVLLVLCGVASLGFAAARHAALVRRLRAGRLPTAGGSLWLVMLPAVVAAAGLTLAVYLVATA